MIKFVTLCFVSVNASVGELCFLDDRFHVQSVIDLNSSFMTWPQIKVIGTNGKLTLAGEVEHNERTDTNLIC